MACRCGTCIWSTRAMSGGTRLRDREQRADTLRLALYIVVAGAGMFVALWLAWQIRGALLLAFAAIVMAVILDAGASWIQRQTRLPRVWALSAVGVLLVALLASFVLVLGGPIGEQVAGLVVQLPAAIGALEEALGVPLLPQSGNGNSESAGGLSELSTVMQDLFGWLTSLGSTLIGLVSAMVLTVVGGVFLAADPDVYRRGMVKLFPPDWHYQVESTVAAAGDALRLWLAAKLIGMVIVGSVAGLGAWVIGLPTPLAIGLFAGLTEFVPTIGAVVGSVPALLLALTMGPDALMWTALLFVAIQQVESNVLTPILERRMVHIPPALMLFAVLAVGLLFGLAGAVVAGPMTVVFYVLVTKLYVREVLGEEAEVPGEE